MKPPSTLLLLWLHITQIIIWYGQWQWPSIAQKSKNHYTTYCHNKYHYSYNCTIAITNACHHDEYCGLYDDFFGYSWWLCQGTCDCDCREAAVYNATLISLYVFLGIGTLLELLRFLMAFSLSSSGSDPSLIGMIGDGIQIRIVQLINPQKWRKVVINDHYYQRLFFAYNYKQPWFIGDLILHQLGSHACAVLLLIYGANNVSYDDWYQNIKLTMILPPILFVINNILKLRYKNGEKYDIVNDVKQPLNGPQFQAPSSNNNNNNNSIHECGLVVTSFTAQTKEQLSVIEGENVSIIGGKNNFDWILVENKSKQKGFVPYQYLKILSNNKISINDEVEGTSSKYVTNHKGSINHPEPQKEYILVDNKKFYL